MRLAGDRPGEYLYVEVRGVAVRHGASPVAVELTVIDGVRAVSLIGMEHHPTWRQVDDALGTGMEIVGGVIEQTWPRLVSSAEFLAHRGRLLAGYCRRREIKDPFELDREHVAEACAYASGQSMANALHVKGLKTAHIQAEAWRLMRE